MERCKILQGIRVADFSWVWVGAVSTMLLAFLGAEVIRIESSVRPDTMRLITGATVPVDPRIPPTKYDPMFVHVNEEKLSVSINLREPEGAELAKKIVAKSDIVVENFSPGVMDEFGLGYEELKKVKPDIIMISASSCGQFGPDRDFPGYDPCFAAFGGLAHLTGYPDDTPQIIMGPNDIRAGLYIVLAALIALTRRQRTGKGQYIEQSDRDTVCVGIGDVLVDYIMNGRVQSRMGNLDPYMAPHNVYRCRGSGKQWVSIAIANNEEWEAFCHAISHPDWLADDRFADPLSRWNNRDELDKLIEGWTINHSKFEVMHKLQKVGVAAVACYDPNSPDIFADTNLRDRESWIQVEDPELNPRWTIAPMWRFSETPATITRHAPLLGEDNDYVFSEVLKMPKAEIQRLKEEKVII